MAHTRDRHLLPVVLQALKLSPLVGVLGHRQVGKTTLLSQITKNYYSFDDADTLKEAIDTPKEFLRKIIHSTTGLDECQLAPPLFPALKERVRLKNQPGQILLSGSVRFSSRKAIRESLTGRILNFEFLPCSIEELENRPPSKKLIRILPTKDFKQGHPFLLKTSDSHLKNTQKSIDCYLKSGGLPGVCFIREVSFRNNKIQEQLLTILDRDLRMVTPTNLGYREILDFTRSLARKEGSPLQHSDLQQETGIRPPVQKKLLYALEALYIIRMLPLEGGRKGYSVYFEDQAESHFLSQGRLSPLKQVEGLLIRHARIEWSYQLGANVRYFQYQTRGGARVPFAIEGEGGDVLGLLPFDSLAPDRSTIATAASFLKNYGRSKILLVSSNHKTPVKVLDSRTLQLSLAELLS